MMTDLEKHRLIAKLEAALAACEDKHPEAAEILRDLLGDNGPKAQLDAAYSTLGWLNRNPTRH